MSRIVMLPPMRPSPIMPSCIVSSPRGQLFAVVHAAMGRLTGARADGLPGDGLRLFLNRLEQLDLRIGKQLDAFDSELVCHILHVDPDLIQPLDNLVSLV